MFAPLLLSLFADLDGLPRLAHAGFALQGAEGKLTVAQVRPGSPAARAGVKAGDVVERVDGAAPGGTLAFVRGLLRRPDGARLRLTLKRGAEEVSATIHYAAPPREPDTLYMASGSPGDRRRLLVTRPAKSGRHPAVLWVAGSGCATLESPDGRGAEHRILRGLTERGYVTIRLERHGIGDSEGPLCYSDESTLDVEAEAHRTALAAVRGWDFVDPRRVFLFAHSAGVTVAPLIARGEGVAGIILAGGRGPNFLEYVLDMRRRELELDGAPDIVAAMQVHTRCLERLLRDRRSPTDVETEFPDCRRKVRFDTPARQIQQSQDLDLAAAWRAAAPAPVLVLYGTGDFVTSEAGNRALTALVNAAHPGSAAMETLPMDHGFLAYGDARAARDAERNGAGGTLCPDLVPKAAKWLASAATLRSSQ